LYINGSITGGVIGGLIGGVIGLSNSTPPDLAIGIVGGQIWRAYYLRAWYWEGFDTKKAVPFIRRQLFL
jgi:hypothetical protein